jgi:uncharacterized protein (DUF1684 family)
MRYRVGWSDRRWVFWALCGFAAAGCGSGGVGSDEPGAYETEIEQWRAERLELLKGPDGYLNLAGLFWLQSGASTLGSAADNTIVLPHKAATRVGELQVSEAGVVMVAEPGVDVRFDGIPVRSILMSDDTTEYPVKITHGALGWSVIKRADRFALRLRDFEHPAIETFPALEYYPVNRKLRVSARFEQYPEPKLLNVDTVIEGLGWQQESPGVVVFEIDGQDFKLEAYASGNELFFVFGDQTSGRETYPAGRFLYADRPADGTDAILDFNRAYNPPCAFNDFATCPVASPQNRLATRIEAGEKFDPAVHHTPGI